MAVTLRPQFRQQPPHSHSLLNTAINKAHAVSKAFYIVALHPRLFAVLTSQSGKGVDQSLVQITVRWNPFFLIKT